MQAPILFYNSRFRQYKLRIKQEKRDKWIIIKDKIWKPEQLLSYIEKYKATDTYQTVSWWLNPQLLGRKKQPLPEYNGQNKRLVKEAKIERFLGNIFLGSDYIMDFDNKDYQGGSSEALNNAELAEMVLRSKGFKEFIMMRTGRGYQLLVCDFNDWAKKDMKPNLMPRERENHYQRKMKLLSEELKQSGVKWDYNVSIDTRRIFRTPNTLHNNGSIIQIIKNTAYGKIIEPKSDDVSPSMQSGLKWQVETPASAISTPDIMFG